MCIRDSYNTLDTIVWLIEGGMTEDAVEMISSLSIFFRTSLSKGNDIIPLSEEKRHTLSYLEIQQFRYRDILEFELSIPQELDGIQVPKPVSYTHLSIRMHESRK